MPQPCHRTRVVGRRRLTDSVFVLSLERRGLPFTAGQSLGLSFPGDALVREYSVYSGEGEVELFELLVKEVPDGKLTPRLGDAEPGDELLISTPKGQFVIAAPHDPSRRYCFIASGTGISPYHAYVRSYPHLDYRILHGIRFGEETYDADHYPPERYTACVSRQPAGHFHGRLTRYLTEHPLALGTHIYLCGNCDMIYDAYQILLGQGHPQDLLYTEVYF